MLFRCSNVVQEPAAERGPEAVDPAQVCDRAQRQLHPPRRVLTLPRQY